MGFIKNSIRTLCSVGLLLSALAGTAYAGGTKAGTNVQITYTLDYQVAGVQQDTIDTSVSGSNTPVEFTVDRRIDLTVSSLGDVTVVPASQDQDLIFRLTNDGNDTQAYALSIVNEGGDDFTATGKTLFYYIDDGDNSFEPDADDGAAVAYNGSATPDLDLDRTLFIVVRSDIPASAEDEGEDVISVVADTLEPSTAASPGTAVTADLDGNQQEGAAENVLADGSGTANENANEGDHSASAKYVVHDPLIVTNTNDSGEGSLRAAIEHANTYTDTDAITFAIPGAGPHVITLASSLPQITDAGVSIDGSTQSGASCGQLTTGTQHTLRIQTSGPASGDAFSINAQGVRLKGLSITGAEGYGVFATGASDDFTLECSYAGVEPDGITKNPNVTGTLAHSVLLHEISNSTVRNSLLSGNDTSSSDRGLNVFDVTGATIQGNIIGLNAAGNAALGNGKQGMSITTSTGVLVGGLTPETGNVISGNALFGIKIQSTSTDIEVIGNIIGLSRDGTSGIGNGDHGISINSDSEAVFLMNRIAGNAGIGIDLGQDGVTLNDPGDGDAGANDWLNYPVINTITVSGDMTVGYDFNLDVPANAEGYRVEFFKNSSADATGYGEGEIYLGFVDTGNHPGGNVNFMGSFTASETVSVGNIISATATRKTGASSYDITSEFSANATGSTGGAGNGFITSWNTILGDGDNTVELLVNTGSSDFNVYWGDGMVTNGASGTASHTYASAGTYDIEITGDFAGFAFDGGGDVEKIIDIKQWGNIAFENWSNGFEGATNLTNYTAVDAPDLSGVTTLAQMFASSVFNGNIGNWDVSNISNMSSMFYANTVFDQNIGGWTTTSLSNLQGTFALASSFDQDISGWNTSGVTTMANLFWGATSFDQDISGWDTSGVQFMNSMFRFATSFDQNIGGWDVGNVGNMSRMFEGAGSFDQDISGWETGNVTNMSYMFTDATGFNQDLNTVIGGGNQGGIAWDTSLVENMAFMFEGANTFNGNITGWDTAAVTNMGSMFWGASVFDQNIGSWTMTSVENISNMFRDATAFNGDISGWTFGAVSNADFMFVDATSFNRDVSGWDFSGDTTLNGVFYGATGFDQSLAAWDISSVTDMSNFLSNTALSVENYDATLTSWDAQTVQSGVPLGAHSLEYCLGASARSSLVSSDSWTITGDTMSCDLEVTNTNDSGLGSLRQAIINANSSATDDAITFAIPGVGPHMISLTSALPQITDEGVNIDASTQSGAVCNNLWDGNGHTLKVQLDGTSAGNNVHAFDVTADNVTLRGLSITNFDFRAAQVSGAGVTLDCLYTGVEPDGATKGPNIKGSIVWQISLSGADATLSRSVISGNDASTNDRAVTVNAANATLTGNFIGTTANGASALGNGDVGLIVTSNGDGTTIGGTGTGEGNLVSGNRTAGISIISGADNISVLGNIIGLNRAGTAKLANGTDGLFLSGATNIDIGDGTAAGRNVISGNGTEGIDISSSSTDVTILGNYIGVASDGSTAMANAGSGVKIHTATNITIGDGTSGGRNIISGNNASGVYAEYVDQVDVLDNYIGTDSTGLNALGNNAVTGSHGVRFDNATNITIDSNVIADSGVGTVTNQVGVLFWKGASSDVTISNNMIGVDKNGENDLGNMGQGVQIGGAAGTKSDFVISDNVISGNQNCGVSLHSDADTLDNVQLTGNAIGTNASGSLAIANGGGSAVQSGCGIFVNSATTTNSTSNVTIGGTSASNGNIISGNLKDGVYINNSSPVTFLGNSIGTNAAGTTAIGNGINGIIINNGANITIGDGTSAGRNIISGNTEDGISVEGISAVKILQNIIHSNGDLGIDLVGGTETDSVTANDSGDADSGPNDLLNFPVINTITASGTTSVMYNVKLDVPANTEGYRIEFYKNSSADSSGHGEGETFLGFVDTGNHAGGSVNFDGTFTATEAVSAGDIISATATRKTGATSYDITSEFSATYTVVSALIVMNTNDSGAGSLRQAIANANASTDMDNITFAIPGAGPHVITPVTALPTITDEGVTIDGASQSGASCNATNGQHTLLVELDGATAGGDGLTVAADNVTINGLSIHGFGNGMSFTSDNGVITCNFIGLESDGDTVSANTNGISVAGDSITIGGTTVDKRNVISGNTADGVVSTAATKNMLFQNNYVGTDMTGMLDRGNGGEGIDLRTFGADDTVFKSNVISANSGSGLFVEGNRVIIQANVIGLTQDQSTAISPNHVNGIYVNGAESLIGGTGPGEGNIITDGILPIQVSSSYGQNTGGQVTQILGNIIGSNEAGTLSFTNSRNGVLIQQRAVRFGDGTEQGRNIVGGSGRAGIIVRFVGDVEINGNYIGFLPDGTTANDIGWDASQENRAGITLFTLDGINLSEVTISNNVIGNADPHGILLYDKGNGSISNVTITGNRIGVDAAGNAAPNALGGILIDDQVSNVDIGDGTVAGRNIISGNTGDGIHITNSADDVTIRGNYIGIAPDGSTAMANTESGIEIDTATNITIGDGTSGGRNIISGNDEHGIYANTVDNLQVLGNYIGTSADGNSDLGNGATPGHHGVFVEGVTNATFDSNVVSGNASFGVYFGNATTSAVTVSDNIIGFNATGNAALGNDSAGLVFVSSSASLTNIDVTGNIIGNHPNHGILFVNSGGTLDDIDVKGNIIGLDSSESGSFGNAIGIRSTGATNLRIGDGTTVGANIIANSVGHGVFIDSHSSTVAILNNSFSANGGLGINLDGGTETDSVTANDNGDGDTGPNDLLNFPVINMFSGVGTSLSYDITLDVPANANGYRVEFYKSSSADASGHGEGETFLGFIDTGNHPGGAQNFTGMFTGEAAAPEGSIISATATRKTGASSYDITSEFSLNYTAASPTELDATKSVAVFDPFSQDLYAIPGNDVVHSITVTNPGNAPADTDSIVIIDQIPAEVTFYNGDVDDGGPESNPVGFSQTGGAGLIFTYGTDAKYSNSGSRPATMAACTYTPSAGYDPNVTYICLNPKGAMQPGDPDPTFTVSYRARIK